MNILIIEDEAALASALVAACKRAGHDAVAKASAKKGLAEALDSDWDLIVLDIGLPDRSGLEVLDDLMDDDDPPPVLIITAHGNLDNAVLSRRGGASEYLVKPFDMGKFLQTVDELLANRVSSSDSETATKDAPPPPASNAGAPDSLFIGGTPAMQPVFRGIAHASTSEVPVLITGPTGTGKSLCAKIIHRHSDRQDGPFVPLHCAALPEQLLEAELFGHEKAAFSGANSVKPGHLERAANGTLFIDEIGALSMNVQAKLLRFIDERTYVRLGGREDIHLDCRIIAASRKDLQKGVEDGEFREDLYYRLRVLEIHLPPLGKRIDDVPALAEYFLACAGDENHRLADDVLAKLRAHTWPGNVRELRNAIEHALAVSGGHVLHASHLPSELQEAGAVASTGTDLESALGGYIERGLAAGWTWQEFHDTLEDRLLAGLLDKFHHKSTALARDLQMNRSTLLKKRKRIESE